MKKLITFIGIVLLCCLLLTSCGACLPDYATYTTFYKELSPKDTIIWNEDSSITYNGIKYTNTNNYNGKISTDYDSEHCVKIATMPYSYLLATVSVFYGDDLENPDIIARAGPGGGDVWIREGMDIDELIMTNNCVVSDSFSFKICDIITEESIPYSLEVESKHAWAVSFARFPLEDYPAFSFWPQIVSVDGELYLQYVHDSDFYKITDEFEAELRENGFID